MPKKRKLTIKIDGKCSRDFVAGGLLFRQYGTLETIFSECILYLTHESHKTDETIRI